jgi:hypothetical protein
MAVRVRISIKTKRGNEVETVSVANAGFETEIPEILLPLPLALKLNLKEKLEVARREFYKAVGRYVEMLILPEELEVYVITQDKKSEVVNCSVIVSETEDEVVMSDNLISEVGLVIEDAGKGIWRFRTDPYDKKRESETPEKW